MSTSEAETLLLRCESPARRWFFAWLMAFCAGLLVRLTIALTAHSPNLRLESKVSALALFGGLVGTLALHPRTAFAAAILARHPEAKSDKERSKQELANQLVRRGLFWERFGRSFVPHLAGAVVNVTAGLYLWLGARLWREGLIAIAAGLSVNTFKILTQPMTATSLLTKPGDEARPFTDPSRRAL